MTTRICLNLLGSARARRETYVGELIPEPLPERTEWITGRPDGTTIEGGDQIAHARVEIASRAPSSMTFLERTVNGQPGLVAQQDGVTVTVFAFDVAGDRIKHIWVVRNPEKLRPWTTG